MKSASFFTVLFCNWVILTSGAEMAEPLEISGIENFFQVTDKIYSGSQPQNETAFSALAKLGVKIILSVDGAVPDVVAARSHGLRYIHLPIGYEGVTQQRVTEFAQLAVTFDAPLFVHCHLGKHRGPTAVALLCLASENWNTNRAEKWLRQAGTSEDYPGLYRAIHEFKNPSSNHVSVAKIFPEITPPSPLVESMVALDHHFERLKTMQKAGWKIDKSSERTSAEEATLLLEQFREMARRKENPVRPENFRTLLLEAQNATSNLRDQLRAPTNEAELNIAFQQTQKSCVICHKTFRNEK